MFGDWGALALQFVVTAVVILGLIGIAYWLVRRYSAVGLGRIGRGRVPRLAIMDAMSVDGRRRLVLVRRDNVEHLILIGGPSDVVVEQAIQRPRRPKVTAPGGDAEQTQPLPVEDPYPASTPSLPPPRSRAATQQNGSHPIPGASTDQPFSFRRTTPVPPPGPPAIPARVRIGEEAPSPARYVDVHRPTRIDAGAGLAPTQAPQESEPLFPDLPTAEPAAETPGPRMNGEDTGSPMHFDIADAIRTPPQPSPYAKPESVAEDTRGKLADLENEMARLLGEITQKRPS
jgi:hypothetical protein